MGTTRSSPLVTLGTSISPTGSPGRGRTGVAWDPAMLQVICRFCIRRMFICDEAFELMVCVA